MIKKDIQLPDDIKAALQDFNNRYEFNKMLLRKIFKKTLSATKREQKKGLSFGYEEREDVLQLLFPVCYTYVYIGDREALEVSTNSVKEVVELYFGVDKVDVSCLFFDGSTVVKEPSYMKPELLDTHAGYWDLILNIPRASDASTDELVRIAKNFTSAAEKVWFKFQRALRQYIRDLEIEKRLICLNQY